MNKQALITDTIDAAIARYAGYNVRWLPAEQMFAILDPGDLQDLLDDVHAGKQSIADAQGLLNTYRQMQDTAKPHTRTKVQGDEEYRTTDQRGVGALMAAGYKLLRVEPAAGNVNYPWFVFEDDGRAKQMSRDIAQKIQDAKKKKVESC